MKKRLLFVHPVLAPYFVPRYACLARSKEFDVHIALESNAFSDRPGWVARDIEGCSVHVLKSFLKRKTVVDKRLGYKTEYTKGYPYSLPVTIHRLQPDAVLVGTPTQFVFALLARSVKRFRLGLLLEDTPNSEAKKRWWVRLARKYLYHFADFALCFSEDAKTYIASLGTSVRLYRSSWSVDPEWLVCERKPRVENAIRFLFVGALIQSKGLMPLLGAWAIYSKNTCDDNELILVGDGPLRDEARDFCLCHGLSNVRIVGNVPYTEVKDFYLDSDVFVLPTMGDLFSLVVTEAMAFGLPIMTTTYNGARELVREGFNGTVFDPTNTDSIVAALRWIKSQSHRLGEMGKNSRVIIAEYTHDKVMTRMAQSLRQELIPDYRAKDLLDEDTRSP